VLPTLEAGSIDAVVCDPPYHLTSIVERFGKEDAAPVRTPEGGTGAYARAARGFMGQTWDGGDVAFRPETWREVLRVLKPGGYLLAFSGTRTYHRMTVAIEDAGFEIRDCLSWQYGSGFPKSLAVDKAIDKIDRVGPMEARARVFTAWMRSTGITPQQVNDATGTCMGHHYTTHPTQPSVATADLFDLLRPLLPPVPDEIEELVRSRTVEVENMKRRKVVGEQKVPVGHAFAGEVYGGDGSAHRVAAITEPHTEAAAAWKGWGTALKPAWEPVVVARKPLEGTVAANVLKYETGAMNIDGCRVPSSDGYEKAWDRPVSTNIGAHGGAYITTGEQHTVDLSTNKPEGGRWPANVILSHGPDCGEDGCAPGCPCAALDAQSGVTKSRASGYDFSDSRNDNPTHVTHNIKSGVHFGDAGGASRFFNTLPIEADDLVPFIYAMKAARSEREEGCGDLPLKEEGGKVRNHHPTVKPVAVMRHLARLCCRKGGVVLDPFMGSGSTGIAAVKEGMRFVGIEMSEDYLGIARARIEAAQGGGFAKTAPPPLTVFHTAYAASSLTTDNGVAMTSVPPTRKEAPVVFIKAVESNVKKGAKVELTQRTLIIGPNGSGKSSIVNAVELALTGRASDVVGRVEVAKGIDLLALAPADAEALWSRATLSDGRTVEWRCERNTKTGGAREATHTLPSDVKPTFPVRAVREALAGSPATVRAWLVGRIGSAVSEAAITGMLPEDLHAAYADLTKPLFGYPAQVLLDAREAAGKQARNAGADAKAANALAESTGAGLAMEPSDDEVERARQRVREAAVLASESVKARVFHDLPALRADAERKVMAYSTLNDEFTRLTVEDNQVITRPNVEVARTRDALTRVLTFHGQHRAEECLVCASPIRYGTHDAMLQRAEALAAAATKDVAVMETQGQLERVKAALPEALRVAQDAVARFRAAEVAMAEADARPATNPDPHGMLRAAEEQIRALESARAAWQNVRAAKLRARDLSARQRLYSDLHAAIEDAIGAVLERARRDFVAKVQSYLPSEDAFDLVLTANGKDVCQFGFSRDGALHTALSGAEWARLTLALAAAVSSGDEADVAVLTPEDRAFDADTLRAVMVGMSNAPGQVILCSPVAPAGRTPKGWTVIDLTAPVEAKPAKAAKAKKSDGLGALTLGGTPDGDDVNLDEFFGTPGEAK